MIKIDEKDMNNFAADLEVATIGDKRVKQACALELHKTDIHIENRLPTDEKTLRNIKKKIKDNDLIVTKADKGNTLIITTKVEYTQKVDEFLNSGQFQILKKDPTESFNKEIKNVVTSCDSILKQTKTLLQMNPTPPRLHGYYKLHKENQPIRPVVAYTGAPAYKLAKVANHLFKKLTHFEPAHTIKNSIDLISKIDHISIPSQAKLVSFDVKNLFPSVPVKDCLRIIGETLCESTLEVQEVIDLEAVLKICLEQNYFSWGNEALQELLSHMNSINQNIQLTMEIGGKSINFLDLTIDIQENHHIYKIYRKPTYSDNIIHATSRHLDSHKHAAFHAFIHRLVKVPMSKDDFQEELNTIKQIARNNGYTNT
ncbi:hypothetical protein NE865_10839 [Phthorimaea operculella]|nr:hypothetical protein NE865_10839 [Phthorimaea operculella]